MSPLNYFYWFRIDNKHMTEPWLDQVLMDSAYRNESLLNVLSFDLKDILNLQANLSFQNSKIYSASSRYYCIVKCISSTIHFSINTNIPVFQFKHLISEAPGLEIYEMWSTFYVFSKLTEILENLYKCQLFHKSKLS